MEQNKMGIMPINKLLLSMSLPMMASMLVQALYNIVDSMFVARLSENALTAVSLAFPAQNLMIAVGTGTGVGINALISRSLGEKNKERANLIANNGLMLYALSGVVFAIFGATVYSIAGAAAPFFAAATAAFSAPSIAAFEGGASVSENLRDEKALICRCIVSSNSMSAVSECVKSISHFTPNSRKIISESFFSICAHFTKSTAPSPTFR